MILPLLLLMNSVSLIQAIIFCFDSVIHLSSPRFFSPLAEFLLFVFCLSSMLSVQFPIFWPFRWGHQIPLTTGLFLGGHLACLDRLSFLCCPLSTHSTVICSGMGSQDGYNQIDSWNVQYKLQKKYSHSAQGRSWKDETLEWLVAVWPLERTLKSGGELR